MAKKPVTRLPDESHEELWALFLRFGVFRGETPINYTGHTFGRWTVVGIDGWGPGGRRWLARCTCGSEKVMRLDNMRKGISASCGCYAAEIRTSHGMSKTRPYSIWAGMLSRCGNPDSDNFPHYGGRGIEVCERWRDSFENFWADMESGYAPTLTLERIDVNGGYNPGNCCWIPKSEQPQNLRCTVRIPTPQGEMTLRQAERLYGINKATLRARIRYGWPLWRLLEGYC